MKRLILRALAVVLLLSFCFVNYAVAAEEESGSVQSEIFYHILVDRFNNGDSSLDEQIDLEDPLTYHGGDLQGITEKLDDLKDLGYTTLVLSPIMENSPNGYHGYWIEDFYQVDDQFGTLEDLRKLVNEAHDRNMKIVLEFVTNYVSENHPITENPDKRDWLAEESNRQSFRWQDKTAVLDQSNPEVQSFLTDVADYWMEEANIDGYQFHAADQGNQAFFDDLTAHIHDKDPNFYLLGNILDDAYNGNLTENTAIQAVENHALYEPMTDVFANAGTPIAPIYETWQRTGEQAGLNYLDNPYTIRFTQKFQENGRNIVTAWKLALTYLYTAPGAPMVYQGSEIPMGGAGFPESQQLVKWNNADGDLQKFTERIGALRSEFPALQHGDYEMLDSSGAMNLFKRSYEGETVYIAINNDTQSQAISLEGIESDKQLKGLLGDNLVRENDQGEFRIGLPRETAEVYVIEDNAGLNWLIIVPIVVIFILFVAGIIYLSRQQKKREADA
ncbi:alpha-amylase family glycosyl hydrolase [Lentibacillus salicampi]|uniref:Alpha-amlyase n=1 Tax=Lentibacillus salicampi TaxID=175306 RepID=A0A4Y9AE17_9BACI|nr:alpha-amylase family glycosyl hydrolase [Lentibacillus salicampi]TFJ93572.1 alpha-amlyase [Lentibacillus salicampi]